MKKDLMIMSGTSEPPLQTKSYAARNKAITAVVLLIVFGVAAVIGFWVAWNRPTRYTSNIVNGLLTINAGGYEYYPFEVPAGASDIQVSGTFTAAGGTGNDIRIYILDSASFVNWVNGHAVSTYYNSGAMTTGTISATLPSSGGYYLVYDNTFSWFWQKNVNTQATLTYTK